MSAQKVVMVTGGTGLVGSAIKDVIDAEGNVEEKWVYLSSKVSWTRNTRRCRYRYRMTRAHHLAGDLRVRARPRPFATRRGAGKSETLALTAVSLFLAGR